MENNKSDESLNNSNKSLKEDTGDKKASGTDTNELKARIKLMAEIKEVTNKSKSLI